MEIQPTKIDGNKYQISIHLDKDYKIVGLPNVSMFGVVMEYYIWKNMNPVISKNHKILKFDSYQDALNFYTQHLVKK